MSGLDPLVYLTRGGFHIREKQWRNKRHHFDLISKKKMGGGEFLLVTPVEIFTDAALKNLYVDADVVRQQMAETIIRIGKYVAGDTSVYYVN